MINQLYIFSGGSYVVADEWNANFKAINNSNVDCAEAIVEANEQLAFVDGDLTSLFAALRQKANSFGISGTSVIVAPECEYYKTLPAGEDLSITIPDNFNSESRIAIRITDDRTLLPFSVAYSGDLKISYGEDDVFSAGLYYILIYEVAGQAIVKLIWTGS